MGAAIALMSLLAILALIFNAGIGFMEGNSCGGKMTRLEVMSFHYSL